MSFASDFAFVTRSLLRKLKREPDAEDDPSAPADPLSSPLTQSEQIDVMPDDEERQLDVEEVDGQNPPTEVPVSPTTTPKRPRGRPRISQTTSAPAIPAAANPDAAAGPATEGKIDVVDSEGSVSGLPMTQPEQLSRHSLSHHSHSSSSHSSLPPHPVPLQYQYTHAQALAHARSTQRENALLLWRSSSPPSETVVTKPHSAMRGRKKKPGPPAHETAQIQLPTKNSRGRGRPKGSRTFHLLTPDQLASHMKEEDDVGEEEEEEGDSVIDSDEEVEPTSGGDTPAPADGSQTPTKSGLLNLLLQAEHASEKPSAPRNPNRFSVKDLVKTDPVPPRPTTAWTSPPSSAVPSAKPARAEHLQAESPSESLLREGDMAIPLSMLMLMQAAVGHLDSPPPKRKSTDLGDSSLPQANGHHPPPKKRRSGGEGEYIDVGVSSNEHDPIESRESVQPKSKKQVLEDEEPDVAGHSEASDSDSADMTWGAKAKKKKHPKDRAPAADKRPTSSPASVPPSDEPVVKRKKGRPPKIRSDPAAPGAVKPKFLGGNHWKLRIKGATEDFHVGHTCFCLLGDKWLCCTVVATKGDQIKIRYNGEYGISDEWISTTSVRLRACESSDLVVLKDEKPNLSPKTMDSAASPAVSDELNTDLSGHLVWYRRTGETPIWLPGVVEHSQQKSKSDLDVTPVGSKDSISVTREDVLPFREITEEEMRKSKEATPDLEKFEQVLGEARDLFVKSLFGRVFLGQPIQTKQPSEISVDSLRESGFLEPFVVKATAAEIGLELPAKEELTVAKIAECVGVNHRIPVIDVEKQVTMLEQWTLLEWSKYFSTPPAERAKVYNVISLEITNTPLAEKIRRPTLVRELDLVDKVWPAALREENFFPKVQLYCLMSAAESFTDFHIDFGGSSVFYNVVSGEKVFFLVPPTPANLRLYEQFMLGGEAPSDPCHGRFADLIAASDRSAVTIKEGDTLFIPSGWIHAVFTPVDSVVIGGNFLHSLSLEREILVHLLEKRTMTLPQFQFPFFDTAMFYAAERYSKLPASDIEQLPKWEQEGLEPLHKFLSDVALSYARMEWADRLLGFSLPFSCGRCQGILEKIREHISHLGKISSSTTSCA